METKEKEDKLNLEAFKKREQEVAKDKAKAPAEKQVKKIKETEFEKVVENLKDEEWSDYDITEELVKKRDLRRVFKVIAKNQPIMVSKIRELLDWTDKKKTQSYELVELLKEMKLVEEVEVLKIWALDYCIKEKGFRSKLTKQEKDILDKFNFWTKSMKAKRIKTYIGASGYWILTEKGKTCVSHLTENKG